MFKKYISAVLLSTTCLLTLLSTPAQSQADEVSYEELLTARPIKICPTDEMKKLKTFDAVECYLIYGTDNRFGKFGAVDPIENFAKLDDGSTWRLFKTEKLSPDLEGVLCYKTIMLKSIIKHINSLDEVKGICTLELAGTDGVFDPVIVIEMEGEKNKDQENLILRLNVFVNFYLNIFAMPLETTIKM